MHFGIAELYKNKSQRKSIDLLLLDYYYKDCVISYKQILIYKHKIPNKENKQTKRIMIQLHVDICFQGA